MGSVLKGFCQKIIFLYSSDHRILFKFCQLVVNIAVKELQIIFWTSTVIKGNENMEELVSKI